MSANITKFEAVELAVEVHVLDLARHLAAGATLAILASRQGEVTERSLRSALRFQGMVRYDAYRDMGGSQSWSIALIDGKPQILIMAKTNDDCDMTQSDSAGEPVSDANGVTRVPINIASAVANYDQALALVREQRAGLFPTLGLSANARRS